MAKFRNASNDTVLDYTTQQVVEPDGVITIDDDLAVNYEGHPVFESVPDTTKRASATKEEA